MTPYYSDPLLTLYHGDALEVLPTIRAASVQAVVTDPPYVIGAVSAGNLGAKSGGWGDMMNSTHWFTAWYRQVASMLVWDKEWIGPGGSQGLRPSYELIALMAQPGFAIEDRGTPDLWRCKVGSYKPNGHPAEKPEPLLRRLVDACRLPQGSVVLDPFAGSGTTAAACRALNLHCIAIEAEEKWCDVIASRCGQSVLDFGGVA